MAETTVAQVGSGEGYLPLRDMDGDHGSLLRQAMEDADLLLAHAVQSSLDVTTATTDALVRALANLRLLQQDQEPCPPAAPPNPAPAVATAAPARRACQMAEAELVFWKAYDPFARQLAPVSAHSLRATRAYHEQTRLTKTFAATTVLPWLAVLSFVLALLLQARLIDGRQLSDKLKALDQQRSQRHDDLRNALDPLCALFTTAQAGATPASARSAAPKGAAAKPVAQTTVLDSSAGTQALRKLWSAQHAALLLAMRQQGLLDEVTHWRQWQRQQELVAALPALLRGPVQLVFGGGTPPAEPPAVPTSPPRLPGTDAEARTLCTQGPAAPSAGGQAHTRAEQIRLNFDADMNLLETAYVPMVMGLLGATAFLLRGVVEHLRNFSYTPRFTSLYLVRLVLGMIAGVLGGALLPTGADSSVRAISPLMLPFLFGYAIEVFFSLLDKLVKNLTPAPATPAPSPASAPRP